MVGQTGIKNLCILFDLESQSPITHVHTRAPVLEVIKIPEESAVTELRGGEWVWRSMRDMILDPHVSKIIRDMIQS